MGEVFLSNGIKELQDYNFKRITKALKKSYPPPIPEKLQEYVESMTAIILVVKNSSVLTKT